MSEGIISGMYNILRTFQSYRLEHFFDDKFTAAQFIILNELISEENETLKKEHDKSQKSKK